MSFNTCQVENGHTRPIRTEFTRCWVATIHKKRRDNNWAKERREIRIEKEARFSARRKKKNGEKEGGDEANRGQEQSPSNIFEEAQGIDEES